MLSCVSDNPQNCQITNIQIISNLLNHEPSCQTVGCILVKRGPIASEIAVESNGDKQKEQSSKVYKLVVTYLCTPKRKTKWTLKQVPHPLPHDMMITDTNRKRIAPIATKTTVKSNCGSIFDGAEA